MDVLDYLDENLITCDLKATNKTDAIKELAGLAKKSSIVKDGGCFLKDVFEREETKSTGIGEGIAFPHARTDSVSDNVIVFGRSSQGVDFEAFDGKPAHLIFLMGIPTANINSYLKMLSYLSRKLKQEDFREKLMLSQEPHEVIQLFQNCGE